ncbi:rCG58653 [Rattus norvegicus]|uniref:RCG58653 n=1 Tax=Rattus norvegicus TaxID=10116 RepID=A6JL96_RAT|nr:rCG58653 [Rattus norvegicus]
MFFAGQTNLEQNLPSGLLSPQRLSAELLPAHPMPDFSCGAQLLPAALLQPQGFQLLQSLQDHMC